MEFEFQYKDDDERKKILSDNTHLRLVAEKNIINGNFLVFSDSDTLEIEVDDLKKDNALLKAQNNALAERTDFHEEVLTEIILTINS